MLGQNANCAGHVNHSKTIGDGARQPTHFPSDIHHGGMPAEDLPAAGGGPGRPSASASVCGSQPSVGAPLWGKMSYWADRHLATRLRRVAVR
eukprot:CAMPEP_0204332778 /NCGR_PEP_ID=MMETSP0469-20131031/16733_1 /ASSEMBLY_ACC=CAM_ASM_000384 /TAXON_ID=2969 /ORGANISM="Oxyrrhis marina" /LENGTH=91 /DNA_ID=CAMNT_0051316005 /DNA_START=172 /DNA_END=443 /DNA_ORIENTATION=+